MTAPEILQALKEGRLTADQAVRALVDLGSTEEDARFIIAVETGASPGDVIAE